MHHVWVNATGNNVYFVDEIDRMTWIRRVVATIRARRWKAVAFCQMTTHVHAILDIPDMTLPAGMQYLNREYSRDFNYHHDRVGQLVRSRYGSRRLIDGADLLGTYAYVVLNPVVEGMCPRAEDWRWSSYATSAGIAAEFPFVDASLVLAELGGSVEALRGYVAGERERRLALEATARYQIPDVVVPATARRVR